MKARRSPLSPPHSPLPLLSTLFLCGGIAVTALAQCLTNLTPADVICAKPPGNDNKKHITVSFNGGTQPEQALIQSALDAWNAHSGTTGVVFDTVPSGTQADYQIIFTLDTSQATGTAGCARQDPDTNTIH